MAEEQLEQVVDTVDGESPAEALNTEQQPPQAEETPQDEHMIPKSRFDEINERYKETKAQLDARLAQEKEAELNAKKQQGEWKELYEQLRAELDEQRTTNERLRLDSLRREVAQKHGYGFLWDRLRGETEEELRSDLQSLIKEMPVPAAPSVNGAAASGDRKPGRVAMTQEEKQVFAAKYSIPISAVPDYID
jgi:ribonucleoside-triphosphate reductase